MGPPGQHGNNRRRGKKSEYAIQLMEKQKAKYTYGILERQFRNMFKRATAAQGVTGEKVNIPSYQLKAGDVVAVREKSKSLDAIQASLANSSNVYEWITWNNDTMQGTYVSVPARIQIPEQINEQFIVELYSK